MISGQSWQRPQSIKSLPLPLPSWCRRCTVGARAVLCCWTLQARPRPRTCTTAEGQGCCGGYGEGTARVSCCPRSCYPRSLLRCLGGPHAPCCACVATPAEWRARQSAARADESGRSERLRQDVACCGRVARRSDRRRSAETRNVAAVAPVALPLVGVGRSMNPPPPSRSRH